MIEISPDNILREIKFAKLKSSKNDILTISKALNSDFSEYYVDAKIAVFTTPNLPKLISRKKGGIMISLNLHIVQIHEKT